MTEEATNTEYLFLRKTAEEYRKKGYEVALESQLDFFPGFRADLLVRKNDETKVIEVKSRSSLALNPKIGELARIIDSKPGWSFWWLNLKNLNHLKTHVHSIMTVSSNVSRKPRRPLTLGFLRPPSYLPGQLVRLPSEYHLQQKESLLLA